MKVRCQQIINEHTQQQHDTSPWLTIGKEYTILAIEIYPTKNFYLLIDDSAKQSPGLHDAKQFEILSHCIPPNWQINAGDLGIVTIGPKSWQEPDFWENCYEGNEAALQIYKHEAAIIMEEEKLHSKQA